jgi:ribosomal protein S18 acetylase RimI-like enzyme
VVASALLTLRQVYRPTAAAVARKEQSAPRRRRLVAEAQGLVCGTVEYQLEADRLHLVGLSVKASHRRLGIARRLVEHLIELAIAERKQWVSLYTVRQTGNVALFEKMGFNVVDEQPAVDLVAENGGEVTEVYMIRAATPPPVIEP